MIPGSLGDRHQRFEITYSLHLPVTKYLKTFNLILMTWILRHYDARAINFLIRRMKSINRRQTLHETSPTASKPFYLAPGWRLGSASLQMNLFLTCVMVSECNHVCLILCQYSLGTYQCSNMSVRKKNPDTSRGIKKSGKYTTLVSAGYFYSLLTLIPIYEPAFLVL